MYSLADLFSFAFGVEHGPLFHTEISIEFSCYFVCFCFEYEIHLLYSIVCATFFVVGDLVVPCNELIGLVSPSLLVWLQHIGILTLPFPPTFSDLLCHYFLYYFDEFLEFCCCGQSVSTDAKDDLTWRKCKKNMRNRVYSDYAHKYSFSLYFCFWLFAFLSYIFHLCIA